MGLFKKSRIQRGAVALLSLAAVLTPLKATAQERLEPALRQFIEERIEDRKAVAEMLVRIKDLSSYGSFEQRRLKEIASLLERLERWYEDGGRAAERDAKAFGLDAHAKERLRSFATRYEHARLMKKLCWLMYEFEVKQEFLEKMADHNTFINAKGYVDDLFRGITAIDWDDLQKQFKETMKAEGSDAPDIAMIRSALVAELIRDIKKLSVAVNRYGTPEQRKTWELFLKSIEGRYGHLLADAGWAVH